MGNNSLSLPQEILEQFDTLQIPRSDVQKLNKIYDTQRHKHARGILEIKSFCKFVDIDQKNFVLKLLAAFRRDETVESFLDFRDFVFSTWNLCTLDDLGMGKR